MTWWMSLIMMIGLPALKFALKMLEQKYPGLTPLIEAILKYLDGGGSMQALSEHVDRVCSGAGCPTPLIHERNL